jgi:hypothetical protein
VKENKIKTIKENEILEFSVAGRAFGVSDGCEHING